MLAWFVDTARELHTRLAGFTPILLRKKLTIDMYLQVCDELKRTLAKMPASVPDAIADKFKMCSQIAHVNNLLHVAGRILRNSVKTTTNIVSSLDIVDHIANIGQYSGLVAAFRGHPNQTAVTDAVVAGISCDDVPEAGRLYKKYKTVHIWASLLAKCKSRLQLESAKDDALRTHDLPDIMMPNWLEQMPQLMVRTATPYSAIDIDTVCKQNRLAPYIISVSNFTNTDTMYKLPVVPPKANYGISAAHVRQTRTYRHIASGGVVGGITHPRSTGTPVIIETNGVLSRFVEASDTILRGTPSTRIHNYNAAMEHVIIKRMRPHVALTATKLDYNQLVDSIINLLSATSSADEVESRIFDLVPDAADPEVRLTVLRSIAPIINEIRDNSEKLTPDTIRELVLCRTGIVENVLRKTYTLS